MSVKRQILGANDDRNMATLRWFIYRLNFASSVGYILKRRSGVDTPNSVIDNPECSYQCLVGDDWHYLYCELIGLLWRDWTLLIISFMGLREFLSLLNIRRGDHLALAACFM